MVAPQPITTPAASPELTLELFGPMRILVHGRPLPHLRSRQSLWVLAVLVLRHPRPVEREWLAGTLWPDSEQSRAFSNLRVALSELRSALYSEGWRVQTPNRRTLSLDLSGADVDIRVFDAAIASGELSALRQAVALYGGPLLEGCLEEWVVPEREAREQHCLHSLHQLGERAISDGDCKAAIGYYQQAVRIDPLADTARRGLMGALAKNGDTNEALQVYREFTAFLKDDPRAVPDEQTSALYQRLRNEVRQNVGIHAVVRVEAPPPQSVKGYLPHPLTDLIGRDDERLEVSLQLRRHRLVTLTGPGGIGKTRLAIEVGREAIPEFKDGVWMVALESLVEDRLVIQQIASVLGLREEPGRTAMQSVTDHLRQKRLLLVLDNCEHLLEASAQVAAYLLQECGEVRILATSREPLGITGETVWGVPALAVPDSEHLPPGNTTLLRVLMSYESVQLFVERVQAVQKGFSLSGSNARTVGRTCQLLDGIPLAIELAAARARAMDIETIAERIGDYLGLLTGGNRAAQSRQQTLRATLDWSYALLSEPERLLLKRLSVFAGGCLPEAVGQVCTGDGVEKGSVQELLTSLVDKSLVRYEKQESADGRYRLLEMVRLYAAEGLLAQGEAASIKSRHRDWFLALAEQADSRLKGAEQGLCLKQMESEHDNLRTALAVSAGQEEGGPAGLRLSYALYRFWSMRGDFSEGRTYLRKALEHEGAQDATAARAKALNAAGALAYRQSDFSSAQNLIEESLVIQRKLGEQEGIANSLGMLGLIAHSQGNCSTAWTLCGESLAIYRDLKAKSAIAYMLHNLANIVKDQGDYATARAHHEESLSVKREMGDQWGIATSLVCLGIVACHQGDYQAARAYHEEGLSICRELEDRLGIAYALSNLGTVALELHDYASVDAYETESLAIERELGDRKGMATSLCSLGVAAHSQGDYAAAKAYHWESLSLRREIGDRQGICDSLGGIAALIWPLSILAEPAGAIGRTGDIALTAGRLLSAAQAIREEINIVLLPQERINFGLQVSRARSALGEDAFAIAWQEGRAMNMEQAVDYALEIEASAFIRQTLNAG